MAASYPIWGEWPSSMTVRPLPPSMQAVVAPPLTPVKATVTSLMFVSSSRAASTTEGLALYAMERVVSPSKLKVKLPPLASHSISCVSSRDPVASLGFVPSKASSSFRWISWTSLKLRQAGSSVRTTWTSVVAFIESRTAWTSSTKGSPAHSTRYESRASPPSRVGSSRANLSDVASRTDNDTFTGAPGRKGVGAT